PNSSCRCLAGLLRGRRPDGLGLGLRLRRRRLLGLGDHLLLRRLALGASGGGLLGFGSGGVLLGFGGVLRWLRRCCLGGGGGRLGLGRVLGGVGELVGGLNLDELALGSEPAQLDGEHLLVVGRQRRPVLLLHVLGDGVRARAGPLLKHRDRLLDHLEIRRVGGATGGGGGLCLLLLRRRRGLGSAGGGLGHGRHRNFASRPLWNYHYSLLGVLLISRRELDGSVGTVS
ncbi:Os04g0252850, partial [Oryza sativa Japonica Group]